MSTKHRTFVFLVEEKALQLYQSMTIRKSRYEQIQVRPQRVNLVKQETGNVAVRHYVSKSRCRLTEDSQNRDC